MTTNVYDKVSGILSSDGRWSVSKDRWVAYVDDTGYDKLAFTSKVGFLFAGSLPHIDKWKRYVQGGMKKGTRPLLSPAMKISIIQVDLAAGEIVFKSANLLQSGTGAALAALFGGSGAAPAKMCWDVNKCALQAVTSAAQRDDLSGGTVVYLKRNSRESNVQNVASAEDAVKLFHDRGILMNIAQQQAPVLLKDAANDPNNPEAQAIAKSILSGDAPLIAPFPGIDEAWSEDHLRELDAALAMYEED
jgi:hypothetical protein